MDTPKFIFIVPYRNREKQKTNFLSKMTFLLKNNIPETDYKILFVEQNDSRVFNRGAMKNLGFLYFKSLYPNHYKNMIFIFNDVDTLPNKYINYDTLNGVIKHFIGYTFTLGGIFSITGHDFEKIKGFPNFWGWGYEDNLIQQRAEENNIAIDRTDFIDLNITKNNNSFNIECQGHIKLICERCTSIFIYEGKNNKNGGDDFTYLKNYKGYYVNQDNILKITYFECDIPYESCIFIHKHSSQIIKPKGALRQNWKNLWNSFLK